MQRLLLIPTFLFCLQGSLIAHAKVHIVHPTASWAPTSNLLGYIQGGGRMIFGFKNKNLKVKELPALQSLILTPENFVDLSFTWQSDKNVIVSRSPEIEWSNKPSKRALPILFRIDIQNPPIGYGDFNPEFLYLNQKSTWTRSN